MTGKQEDITAQQRLLDTLRSQEAELAAIYENAPSVLMLVDRECKVRKVNRRAVSLTGVDVKELVGCRGGEVLGCIHALGHPEGCGFAPHCGACAAGNTVHDTIETGHSHHNVEVFIHRAAEEGTKKLPFLLSTSRITLHGETLALVSFTDISQLKGAQEALRQTNERLRTVMDSLNALIYVADMSTYELLFVNKYGRDVWGDIEGKICWQTLQSGQDGPCAFCTNDKLLKEDGTSAGVYAWQFQNTKNGSWYDCRDQAITWSDGRLVRMEIATDITDRVLQEKQLSQAAADELQTMSVLNGLLQLSMEDCSFQEMLQRFLRLITSFPFLGLKPQGAVLLVDENDPRKLVMAANHNLAPQLLTICAEVPFGRCLCGKAAADGELLFVNHVDDRHENHFAGMPAHGHYCVPFKTSDGKLLGVFTLYVPDSFENRPVVEETLLAVAASLAGIIRHHRMTRTVAEREARYRAITDAAMDGIVMMDEHGLINFLNPAAEQMFGYSAGEAVGKNLHTLLVPPRYAKDYQPALARFWATGQGDALGKTLELHGRHRDGHELPVELSLSALKKGEAWQAVAIVRDISERKRHEAEKERLNRELNQAYKMEAIGTLAGGIAHDFNNLLTAMLGFTELVKDDLPEDSPSQADLEKVIWAGKRARDLTRQILAFSRQSEQEIIPVKIQLILKEALKLLRASIPSTIDMIQEIDPDCPAILADPGQLHQIVMNLCTNAYQAMKDGGGMLTVGLRTTSLDEAATSTFADLSPGKFVLLTVTDNGPGIPAELIDRIFDPFFTTKPQGEGTGMGLSIVHGIVAELGGAVQVHSSPGHGADFRVYFPVATDFEIGQNQADQNGVRGHGQILLVDDEAPLLEINTRNLSKFGYTVTPRTSSTEALAAFLAMPDKFDLVLTDQAMPNMTGMDMAQKILKIRPVPIILMTGFADAATAALARESGISEVLTKPVEQKDLTRAIRRNLRLKAEG